MPDPMIGRVLHGTIEIKRLIGQGGMGSVYEGWQEHLERRVAVKVMTPGHARNPAATQYFIREAKQSSKLRHPNIIQIIDYGQEDDETLFIAMEFVPGRPLSSVLREEFPLGTRRVASIVDQTLAALEEAHDKKVVHRDLKPDNLMVEKTRDDSDFVKVLDFGIAQSKASGVEAGPMTQAGALVGTPRYMSPEQATGSTVDHRSDLFSMGTILYEMLTMTQPFAGSHIPQVLMSVIQGDFPSPSAAAPHLEIDPQLEAACLRAMKREIDLRYQTATEFRAAIREVLERSEADVPDKKTPAHFIFKRSNKATARAPEDITGDESQDELETVAGVEPPDPGAGFAATQALHGGMAGESEVVDVSRLFNVSEVSEVSEAETPDVTIRSDAGVDVEELRNDLVGEKRFVTALVLHQRAKRRIDTETLAELGAKLDNVLAEVAERWDAVVHSRQGSFATLLFGFPDMAADDGTRAAQAALDLRKRLEKLAGDHGMTFGIALAQGEVFCPSGDSHRASGAVLDDASDLSRDVPEGKIWVLDHGMQTQLDRDFRLGPPTVEGSRELQTILDVAPKAPESGIELVGRDREIASVLGALGRLAAGNGGVFLVTGEGGMGKSAILASMTKLASDREIRVGRARQRRSGHEGIRDILTQWIASIAEQYGRNRDLDVLMRELGVPTEYARVLVAFARERLHETFEGASSAREAFGASTPIRQAIDAAMRSLLETIIVSDRPIVLCLDQVLRYDDELDQFLDDWHQWSRDRAALFAVGLTVQPGVSFARLPDGATVMHLDPIDAASSRAFLRSRLGQATEEQMDELARLSGGVPLHLDQIVRWARLHPQKLDASQASEWLSEASDVKSILQLRLFNLERNAQNVLALIAALGGEASGEVIMDLANDSWHAEEVFEQLWNDGLIKITGSEESPYVIIDPPVFSGVVYGQLSRKARLAAHERIADYYRERVESDDDSTREFELALAKHLEVLGKRDEALEVLHGLVDRSVHSYEFDVARGHIEKAVSIARSAGTEPDRIARLELDLVRVLDALGQTREAIDLCRKIDKLEGLDTFTGWEVRLELARLWLGSEDPAMLERLLVRLREEIGEEIRRAPDKGLDALAIRSDQLLGEVFEKEGRFVKAAEVLLDAVERGESIDPENNPWGPRLIWEPLNQLGRIRLRKNELSGANRLFEAALQVATAAGDTRGEIAARANLASLFAAQNRLDAAYRAVQTTLKLARRIADIQAVAKLEHNRGQILLKQNREDLARQAFDASLDISRKLDWREGIALNSSALRG